MSSLRTVRHIFQGKPTLEGAGVKLVRIFGYNEVPHFDPFLLLDHFGSDNPADYLAGFPWHPHRGIETVTYMLSGSVEHGDSMGNSGVISSGDVQWMTAGNGIIHQEMPQAPKTGRMEGFQLWCNLPASHKMIDPRYRGISAKDIPATRITEGVLAKVICGHLGKTAGAVHDIVTEPLYIDITAQPNARFEIETPAHATAFAYIYRGAVVVGENETTVDFHRAALLDKGDCVQITTGPSGASLIFCCARPIMEPVAWNGPIVMNTEEELETAFNDFENGTFVRNRAR